jgi:hypothetical protein
LNRVVSYEAVEQVLSDAGGFANEPLVSQNTTFKDTLLALDPPEHTRKRSLVSWIQAANWDPAVFDDPDTYDPTREDNPNIAFGRGPHACLGVHLAKLEGRVATEVLFDRVDTTGYNFMEYFDTTGCRKSPRDYSRQYESLELVETSYESVEAPFLHGVQELLVRYERAVGTHSSS